MVVFPDALVRTRFLIVVRRGEEGTYRYLKERLASVRGVEITIDRRETPSATTPADRRRPPARFNAFGVLLVRR